MQDKQVAPSAIQMSEASTLEVRNLKRAVGDRAILYDAITLPLLHISLHLHRLSKDASLDVASTEL